MEGNLTFRGSKTCSNALEKVNDIDPWHSSKEREERWVHTAGIGLTLSEG